MMMQVGKEEVDRGASVRRHYWLYVLKLESDKYYVGITAKWDPNYRIQQHISGYYGAKWTSKYKYIDTLELIDLGLIEQQKAELKEHKKTVEYMDRYGYQNVRGGGYNYTGRYIKRFGRLFIFEDWEIIVAFVFLSLVITILLLDKYGVF